MSKISLIIKREYMSRVKKKSFVIVSLLAPIGMILLMLLPALIQMLGATSVNNIAVIDRTKEKFSSALTSNNSTKFIFLPDTTSEDSVRAKVSDETYLAYMVLTGTPANKENVKMYAKSTMPVDIVSKGERDLREGVRKNRAQCSASFNSIAEDIEWEYGLPSDCLRVHKPVSTDNYRRDVKIVRIRRDYEA